MMSAVASQMTITARRENNLLNELDTFILAINEVQDGADPKVVAEKYGKSFRGYDLETSRSKGNGEQTFSNTLGKFLGYSGPDEMIEGTEEVQRLAREAFDGKIVPPQGQNNKPPLSSQVASRRESLASKLAALKAKVGA